MGCGPAAAAAAAGHIYIAGSGQLRALNAGTLTSDGRLAVPGPVVAAAVDHQRHRLDLLVAGNSNSLLAVDISGVTPPRVLAQRTLGMTPVALSLSPDEQRVYVLGRFGAGPGKVEAIDLASGHIAAWTTTGAQPAALALSGDGTHLAVANRGSVSLYSLPALELTGTIKLDTAPSQIIGLPFGAKLFALCGDTVAVLDAQRRQLLTYLPVGPRAQQLLAKPDGGEVYVSNASGSVSVINTATNEVATTMPAGLGAGAMAVAADGSALYVANAQAGTISVLNLADRSLAAMVHVGEQPQLLQLSANAQFLFAADVGSGDLAVVRSNRDPNNPNTLVTLVSSPPQPEMLLAGRR